MPCFQANPVKKMDQDFIFDEQVTMNNKNQFSNKMFIQCSLTVSDNTEFRNNFAFGSKSKCDNGGAIFLTQSMIQICSNNVSPSIIFANNRANIGGAICAQFSAVLISNCKFNCNIAMKYGGAIYFQSDKNNLPQDLIDIGTSYENNIAHELGGAYCISSGPNVYFESIKVKNNSASFAGGGIFVYDTNYVKLYTCSIQSNKVESKSKVPYISFGRGGGGIFMNNQRNNQGYFDSYHCCLNGNFANGFSFGKGPGHDVMLSGIINWTSVQDVVNSDSISMISKDSNQNTVIINNISGSFINDCKVFEKYENIEMIQNIPNHKNSINSSLTFLVPEPTKFTYVATQITKMKKYSYKPNNIERIGATFPYTIQTHNINIMQNTNSSTNNDKFKITNVSYTKWLYPLIGVVSILVLCIIIGVFVIAKIQSNRSRVTYSDDEEKKDKHQGKHKKHKKQFKQKIIREISSSKDSSQQSSSKKSSTNESNSYDSYSYEEEIELDDIFDITENSDSIDRF